MLAGELGALALGQAVAERAEPAIERERALTVIALEIAVMQVVEIGSRRPFAVGDRALVAVVTLAGPSAACCRLKRKWNGCDGTIQWMQATLR